MATSSAAQCCDTFHQLGLNKTILNILKRIDFERPTEIQCKAIPLIKRGRNVVGMARTGSGKTAAYILPIIDCLESHKEDEPFRAIILSPTRELAMQVFNFARPFSRATGLKIVAAVGGKLISDDFAKFHTKPDIVVCTPGRLADLITQMKLQFRHTKYLIVDEADKLFEAGFEPFFKIIYDKISYNNVQVGLFSATLPYSISNFIKTDLKNPDFIEVDEGNILSQKLGMLNFFVRCDKYEESLIFLVSHLRSSGLSCLIFLPTKHHVLYFEALMQKFSLDSTFIYSSLNQESRQANLNLIKTKKCSIMLSTDLASRGIDIPDLDVVINANFPDSSKLFMHRVGRVARMQNRGLAVNIITQTDIPSFIEVLKFLNFGLSFVPQEGDREIFNIVRSIDKGPASGAKEAANCSARDALLSITPSGYIGSIDDEYLAAYNSKIQSYCDDPDMARLSVSMDNAAHKFDNFLPKIDKNSLEEAKEFKKNILKIKIHELLASYSSLKQSDKDMQSFLDQLKNYKCKATIFESFTNLRHKEEMAKQSVIAFKSKVSSSGSSLAKKLKEKNPIKGIKRRDVQEAEKIMEFSKKLRLKSSANVAVNDGDDVNKNFEIKQTISEKCFNPSKDDFLDPKMNHNKKIWDKHSMKFKDIDDKNSKTPFQRTNSTLTYDKWIKTMNSAPAKSIRRRAKTLNDKDVHVNADRYNKSSEAKSINTVMKERELKFTKQERLNQFKQSKKFNDNKKKKVGKQAMYKKGKGKSRM